VHSFEVAAVKQRLAEAGGGYEVVHESAGLELGVYVLVAPEPIASSRTRTTSSTSSSKAPVCCRWRAMRSRCKRAPAVFVEAGADHRFTAYEHLSVLVLFERRPAENP
jgi:hypothetical protein